jgi:hypothetical protein
MLGVRISIRARRTTLCDQVCQWPATCRWFSPDLPVSYTNKAECHDITEILRFELPTSMVIGTDSIGSFKSIYHTITATTAPVDYMDCRDIWRTFYTVNTYWNIVESGVKHHNPTSYLKSECSDSVVFFVFHLIMSIFSYLNFVRIHPINPLF